MVNTRQQERDTSEQIKQIHNTFLSTLLAPQARLGSVEVSGEGYAHESHRQLL